VKLNPSKCLWTLTTDIQRLKVVNNNPSNAKLLIRSWQHACHDPSLGFTTKAKGLQGCEPRPSLGVTFSCPGNAKECERMNPHTPKWTPMLGVEVLVDSQMFREWLQGSKPNGSKSSLYYWKAIET